MIPKEKGTEDPAKTRPITVSSVLVRLFNKIFAKRLEEQCPVSPRQKAFRWGDGIAENIHTLQSAIRHASQQKTRADPNKKPQYLYVCFLDVKKAFDSVSHDSLLIACRRLGVPEPLLKYIHGSYERGATCLQSGSEQSTPISCKQGVKQGDPLSCLIFNAVIDWVLTSIDPKIGFQYVDHKEGPQVWNLKPKIPDL